MQLVEARGGGGSQVASAVYCCGVADFCFLPPSSAPDALLSPDFFFSTGEDISECGGRGRESSQGYGYVPEDVSHYDYDALEVAADGGAARIAEGEEWYW
jgi:hypothetical protein